MYIYNKVSINMFFSSCVIEVLSTCMYMYTVSIRRDLAIFGGATKKLKKI